MLKNIFIFKFKTYDSSIDEYERACVRMLFCIYWNNIPFIVSIRYRKPRLLLVSSIYAHKSMCVLLNFILDKMNVFFFYFSPKWRKIII